MHLYAFAHLYCKRNPSQIRIMFRYHLCLASIVVLLTLAQGGPIPMPSPAAEGEPCSFGGFGNPKPCERGLTCIISNFGNPPVDNPRVGTCTVVKDPPSKCTVAFCAMNGADAVCKTVDSIIATCGAWAKRDDLGGVKPVCPQFCTLECRIPQLVASNGETFCNLCGLQSASCRSGFVIFGPVPSTALCRPPISIFQAAQCCIEQNIGCLGKGKRCSTAGSRIRPVPCQRGLTCVITNFGFPAVDRPNSGKCRRVKQVKRCRINRCSRKGPRLVCAVPLPRGSGIISTCKAWARRSDGNPGPKCDFICPEICAVTKKPVASNGQEFCSVCKLRRASCDSDFMIFGPVRRT